MHSMPNPNLNANHLKSVLRLLQTNSWKRYVNHIPLLPAPIYSPIYTYLLTIGGLFVAVCCFQFQPSLKLNLPRLKPFQPEFQIYL